MHVTPGGLLILLFIGLPILGTVLWWVIMLVAAPFIGIGAGAQAVRGRRAEKRQSPAAFYQHQLCREQYCATSAEPGTVWCLAHAPQVG